ncbi:class I SAM-dependent methyltransferase [Candidatus Poribacteria bacterium]|nr:class I SAM-dependent methyltransferase [Candidatus Poribacteria bacterium]
MSPFYRVNGIGDIYVPAQFREIASDDAPLKRFTHNELGQLNRIFDYIRRGGVAILSGEWEQITRLMTYIERKQKELIQLPSPSGEGPKERSRRAQSNAKRMQVRDVTAAMARLMCWADGAGILQVESPPEVPYLLEFIGENLGANKGCPFLIPVLTLERVQNALAATYPIHALGMSLLASENVLAPRSQETIQLFQRGLQSVKKHLPSEAAILDMGCGAGCLALLAAQELGAEGIKIYATDLLPEAVATTRLNTQRAADSCPFYSRITVMPAGDLFQPVSSLCFDLIIFNAPWVVSRARNRAEIAIHDENQETLHRFFRDAPGHLKEGGCMLLGYADASGPKAIAHLETLIENAGFTVANRFKERVATHRSKGKWENIMVYELNLLASPETPF